MKKEKKDELTRLDPTQKKCEGEEYFFSFSLSYHVNSPLKRKHSNEILRSLIAHAQLTLCWLLCNTISLTRIYFSHGIPLIQEEEKFVMTSLRRLTKWHWWNEKEWRMTGNSPSSNATATERREGTKDTKKMAFFFLTLHYYDKIVHDLH